MRDNKHHIYFDGENRDKYRARQILSQAVMKYGDMCSEESVIYIWANLIYSKDVISENDLNWFYKKYEKTLNQHGYYYNPESK